MYETTQKYVTQQKHNKRQYIFDKIRSKYNKRWVGPSVQTEQHLWTCIMTINFCRCLKKCSSHILYTLLLFLWYFKKYNCKVSFLWILRENWKLPKGDWNFMWNFCYFYQYVSKCVSEWQNLTEKSILPTTEKRKRDFVTIRHENNTTVR